MLIRQAIAKTLKVVILVFLVISFSKVVYADEIDFTILPLNLKQAAAKNNCSPPNAHYYYEGLEVAVDPPYAFGYFELVAGREIHRTPNSFFSALYWCQNSDESFSLWLWTDIIDKWTSYKITDAIEEFSCSNPVISNDEASTGVRIFQDKVDLSDYVNASDKEFKHSGMSDETIIFLDYGAISYLYICKDGEWIYDIYH